LTSGSSSRSVGEPLIDRSKGVIVNLASRASFLVLLLLGGTTLWKGLVLLLLVVTTAFLLGPGDGVGNGVEVETMLLLLLLLLGVDRCLGGTDHGVGLQEKLAGHVLPVVMNADVDDAGPFHMSFLESLDDGSGLLESASTGS